MTDDAFKMANLSPEMSGLPFVVWISSGDGNPSAACVKVSMGPRAKPSEMVSITVNEPIEPDLNTLSVTDLTMLRGWIRLNRAVLLDYWTGKIGFTAETIAKLQKMS